jgi:hypothetical protein
MQPRKRKKGMREKRERGRREGRKRTLEKYIVSNIREEGE